MGGWAWAIQVGVRWVGGWAGAIQAGVRWMGGWAGAIQAGVRWVGGWAGAIQAGVRWVGGLGWAGLGGRGTECPPQACPHHPPLGNILPMGIMTHLARTIPPPS